MTGRERDMISSVERFGAPRQGIVSLHGRPKPRHLDHLDLMRVDQSPLVDAVVEMAGRVVLYVVRGPTPSSEIRRLQHILTERGAADHLAILDRGVLDVYPVVTTGSDTGVPKRRMGKDRRSRRARAYPGTCLGNHERNR